MFKILDSLPLHTRLITDRTLAIFTDKLLQNHPN